MTVWTYEPKTIQSNQFQSFKIIIYLLIYSIYSKCSLSHCYWFLWCNILHPVAFTIERTRMFTFTQCMLVTQHNTRCNIDIELISIWFSFDTLKWRFGSFFVDWIICFKRVLTLLLPNVSCYTYLLETEKNPIHVVIHFLMRTHRATPFSICHFNDIYSLWLITFVVGKIFELHMCV